MFGVAGCCQWGPINHDGRLPMEKKLVENKPPPNLHARKCGSPAAYSEMGIIPQLAIAPFDTSAGLPYLRQFINPIPCKIKPKEKGFTSWQQMQPQAGEEEGSKSLEGLLLVKWGVRPFQIKLGHVHNYPLAGCSISAFNAAGKEMLSYKMSHQHVGNPHCHWVW